MLNNSFSSLISPFTNLFKKSVTPLQQPQYSILQPRTKQQPPQTQSLIPPNMSTPSGPVYNSPTSQGFNPSQPIPQVTQQLPPTTSTLPQPSPQTFTPPVPSQPPTDTQKPTQTAASAPPVPSVSPESQKALQLAEGAYQKLLQISPDELSTQEDIDKLIAEATKIQQSGRLGLQATSEQPIPMEFITGQQRAIENRLMNTLTGLESQAEPLERKLARQQAARTSSLEASKFALERADKAIEKEKGEKPFTVSEGASIFYPETNKFIGTAPKPANISAPTTMQTEQGIMQWDTPTQSWKSTGFGKAPTSADITRIEKQKEAEATKVTAMRRTMEQTSNALTAINKIKPIIQKSGILNPFVSTALGRATLGRILPGEAADLRGAVTTVKSLIGFGALEDMRKASPTGGALGQVSERENTLLQSTIASLDPAQKDKTIIENLNQIKQSFSKIRALIVVENGGQVTATITSKDTGEIISVPVNKQELEQAILQGHKVEF